MGNLERLRHELNTEVSDERKEKINKDIRQRKDQCKSYRAMGIVPSPGYVVFNQIDVNGNGTAGAFKITVFKFSQKNSY